MKTKCMLIETVVLTLFAFKSFTQNMNESFIPAGHLNITYNKTTNLIFPFPVQSLDRGSKDVLVQQPKGTENIVQLKAAKLNFIQTNLSVITVDGKLYSFTVDYAGQPAQLNIIVQKTDQAAIDSTEKKVILSSGYNEAKLLDISERLSALKNRHLTSVKRNRMLLRLSGMYINSDLLFFRLQLQNRSNMSYDPEDIRFIIKDRQQAKRTATQDIDLTPVYRFNMFDKVPSDSSGSCVIALPQFTLSDSKYLIIEMGERNGDRNLELYVTNRQLIKADKIE